jgi:hypothetical protein
MPLYDVDKNLYLWLPHKIENWESIREAKKRLDVPVHAAATDAVLNELQPSIKSNLVWTKVGAIYGPKAAYVEKINFIWKEVTEVWEDPMPLIYVGSLLMWRISLRKEQWFTSSTKLGKIDPVTDKEITQRSYWINEDFKVHHTVQDLMSKFGK